MGSKETMRKWNVSLLLLLVYILELTEPIFDRINTVKIWKVLWVRRRRGGREQWAVGGSGGLFGYCSFFFSFFWKMVIRERPSLVKERKKNILKLSKSSNPSIFCFPSYTSEQCTTSLTPPSVVYLIKQFREKKNNRLAAGRLVGWWAFWKISIRSFFGWLGQKNWYGLI